MNDKIYAYQIPQEAIVAAPKNFIDRITMGIDEIPSFVSKYKYLYCIYSWNTVEFWFPEIFAKILESILYGYIIQDSLPYPTFKMDLYLNVLQFQILLAFDNNTRSKK